MQGNVTSDSNIVPTMKLLQKIHKPVPSDGVPKTRAIVGASSAMTARASEFLCDLIESVSRSQK